MPLRARDIADICDELAIERASVTVMGGWDPDATQFFLTFGPPAYRQSMTIDPNWDIEGLKAKLEAATAPVLVAHSPHEIVRMDPIEPAKSAQKRKKANARP